MATVLIVPVVTKTKDGCQAEVSGIDVTDHDCLIGTIDTPASGKIEVAWNDVGICRDTPQGCNLDIAVPVADL
jgi:hypothetical protein